MPDYIVGTALLRLQLLDDLRHALTTPGVLLPRCGSQRAAYGACKGNGGSSAMERCKAGKRVFSLP